MDEDRPIASQEVFLEGQMNTITAVVKGLLEQVLKDHVGALQLEEGRRATVPSK